MQNATGQTFRVAPSHNPDDFIAVYAANGPAALQEAAKRMGGRPVMFEARLLKPSQPQRRTWKNWWAWTGFEQPILVKARNKGEAARKACSFFGRWPEPKVALVK